MRTLITGTTGILGGNLLRLMAGRGDSELRATVRERSNRASHEGLEVEQVLGDIRDREAMRKAVRGCDRVIHCAASTSLWRPNLPMMREVNVEGTRNVLEAALEAGAQRVVYVSTVDTLGLAERGTPGDETTEWGRMADFKNPYFETKMEAEKVALEIAARGLEVIIVNPTFMIGEWDVKPSSGQMIIEVARGRVAVYPDGGQNFVDVLDVAQGILLAMEKGRPGEKYVLANKDGNMTYRDFWTLVAKVVGVRPPRIRVPYAAAVIGGYVFDAVGRLFGIEPDVNSSSARFSYETHYFNPQKAIRELGLPQSPIEPAIKRAYEWFKSRGMI
jgi:dihydroflavonol-4-reductase